MVKTVIWFMFAVIVTQRLVELAVARRNRLWACRAGAREFGAGHYRCFFLLHAIWLAGWVVEGSLYNNLSAVWYVWLGVFLSAQIVRYWCIASLGRHWNTRILIIPGSTLIRRGPYRMLKHPNYLAVAVELMSVPMIFGATITAVLATMANAVLLLYVRIPAEEQAFQVLAATETEKEL
ncbi:isoprenylcysteine carboxyl methyltransferase family protein [Sporomusa acidovorans]|uniref:Isoprenylcysteine carboxyl methyltransferase (ICMT) family protein n=1 Tax=Sporomusa acidovorans (strain ATCC 49682 / DSM 3132 / Mol) TaxID=1123286 RepID=A0ABZ3IZ28_SPOA4|nr:isoprenylcysteine carboxylmethyltransferase family protein [Sporomusa acidovorans]OZC16856.1 isoprenylcysteine carboxyl methyltransferase (ICMT) family protein [Sporomusa acidovorans DSM 3132]SDF24479.1 methyltransferase [Sporomusa acidovorans]